MTPETLVFVVLLLVVKYTLEFAHRTGSRRRRRRSRGAARVIDFTTPTTATAVKGAATATPDLPGPTGDPFWDMVTARISALPDAPDTSATVGD